MRQSTAEKQFSFYKVGRRGGVIVAEKVIPLQQGERGVNFINRIQAHFSVGEKKKREGKGNKNQQQLSKLLFIMTRIITHGKLFSRFSHPKQIVSGTSLLMFSAAGKTSQLSENFILEAGKSFG